jgi:hypothetical protein
MLHSIAAIRAGPVRPVDGGGLVTMATVSADRPHWRNDIVASAAPRRPQRVAAPQPLQVDRSGSARRTFRMPPCSMATTELGRNGASLN